MAAFLYEFDWNPAKAQANFSKHGVDFERAATVFLDPLGKDAFGHDVLVIHTFEWLADDRGRVRLISARKPTRAEIRDYEEQV